MAGQITFTNGNALRMTTTKQYDYLNRLMQISSQPDTIGNRTQTKAGGDQTGGNQRLAHYSVNNLNQITSRDYPGTNDIIGVALATNAVTLNGQPAFHKWEYFWGTIHTNNSASPAWLTAIAASGGSSSTGSLYMAETPEQFSYDADGNLTSDGRWTYAWDAENRLIGMAVNTSVGPQYQLGFVYDAKGRRIQKIVTNGVAVSTVNFLYDGWNLVASLNPQSSILQSFMWGSDLSGSMQGAGGVGGLLEVSYSGGTPTTNCFPAFDGNGNVAALVNVADGTWVANYEYGPFGEVIRITGPMAKVNPIRFSTKYDDDESDLLYYGYRYYKPSTGTWVSRDPMEEIGGMNLFGFVRNNPITRFDLFGLDGQSCTGTGTGTGSCKCDVTRVLNDTLFEVDRTFMGWDVMTELKSCVQIINPFSGATGKSWDIEELHKGFGKGGSECNRMVTFNGQCYYSGAVNYALFGRACLLCNSKFGKYFDTDVWDLDHAILYTEAWKLKNWKRYGFGPETLEAFPFVKYGYDGTLPPAPLGPPCSPNTTPAKNSIFHWHWLPGKTNPTPPSGSPGYSLQCS